MNSKQNEKEGSACYQLTAMYHNVCSVECIVKLSEWSDRQRSQFWFINANAVIEEALAPFLRQQGGGRINNICSVQTVAIQQKRSRDDGKCSGRVGKDETFRQMCRFSLLCNDFGNSEHTVAIPQQKLYRN